MIQLILGVSIDQDEPWSIGQIESNAALYVLSNCMGAGALRFQCSSYERTCYTVNFVGDLHDEVSENRI